MSAPVVVAIPDDARDSPFVAMLIAEIAVLRGTSVAAQRVYHGLDNDPPEPIRRPA